MSAPETRVDDQTYFDDVVTAASATLIGDEVLLANVSGERTDFIRLNHGDVRQAGTVDQRTLTVDLVEGRRHTAGSIRLSGVRSIDDARLSTLLAQLRDQRRLVADDPFLLYNTEPTSTERIEQGSIPPPDAALADIRAAGNGRDLVGIYASGDTFSGFANSLGQRNWFQSSTFNLDWCFYLRADKAAKNLYAGFEWDDRAFASKVEWSARQVAALEREPVELSPGEYRTYLAPRAMEELLQLLSYYGAFGRRAHETRQTPLLKMLVEDVSLSPLVSISEDTANGVAANFQSAGFLRPDSVPLIVDGTYAETLVSPRSAQEYGVATNGATDGEYPQSISVAPGTIAADAVDEALGTGLYVGNLWYTNFSDRAACRTTGMTRFATFWMDGGDIVAPVNVLRFDDTAYHLLGDRLEGLTDTPEVLLDTSTYMERSTDSARLPGALVGAMRFVL
ncbi:MAG TPA: metallopeptidase TldD-related protein [Ilumatobacteraceae bacterium]|nr:metallopeptidase TldD-related protein [Ilumatobacteraceae bacterium]